MFSEKRMCGGGGEWKGGEELLGGGQEMVGGRWGRDGSKEEMGVIYHERSGTKRREGGGGGGGGEPNGGVERMVQAPTCRERTDRRHTMVMGTDWDVLGVMLFGWFKSPYSELHTL